LLLLTVFFFSSQERPFIPVELLQSAAIDERKENGDYVTDERDTKASPFLETTQQKIEFVCCFFDRDLVKRTRKSRVAVNSSSSSSKPLAS
jgi:hypothetical protein